VIGVLHLNISLCEPIRDFGGGAFCGQLNACGLVEFAVGHFNGEVLRKKALREFGSLEALWGLNRLHCEDHDFWGFHLNISIWRRDCRENLLPASRAARQDKNEMLNHFYPSQPHLALCRQAG
jgi:hypothetical protein